MNYLIPVKNQGLNVALMAQIQETAKKTAVFYFVTYVKLLSVAGSYSHGSTCTFQPRVASKFSWRQ